MLYTLLNKTYFTDQQTKFQKNGSLLEVENCQNGPVGGSVFLHYAPRLPPFWSWHIQLYLDFLTSPLIPVTHSLARTFLLCLISYLSSFFNDYQQFLIFKDLFLTNIYWSFITF